MLEPIRAWLNGPREYYTGVALYSHVGTNEDLLEVLMKGPNDFRVKRLQEELLHICNQLKSQPNEETANSHGAAPDGNEARSNENGYQQQSSIQPANEALYNACTADAKQAYKKTMNDRATLFSLANAGETWEDPNLPHKIADRVKLALDVVTGWQHVSQLYDKADYVKLHGRLPADQGDQEENEYDHLQDYLVKLRLDNARKALNKLKAKETTPERIALMQKHEENIKKLEAKWHSLKPQQ